MKQETQVYYKNLIIINNLQLIVIKKDGRIIKVLLGD